MGSHDALRISSREYEVRGSGGRGGIRTHGTLAGTPVFKTGRLNHSRTLPNQQHQALSEGKFKNGCDRIVVLGLASGYRSFGLMLQSDISPLALKDRPIRPYSHASEHRYCLKPPGFVPLSQRYLQAGLVLAIRWQVNSHPLKTDLAAHSEAHFCAS